MYGDAYELTSSKENILIFFPKIFKVRDLVSSGPSGGIIPYMWFDHVTAGLIIEGWLF